MIKNYQILDCKNMFNLKKIHIYLVILLPFVLVTGPFLSNFFVSSFALISIYLINKKKNYTFYNNVYFKLFALFCIYILINSLFSDYPRLSLESSLFYFRFGFFVAGIIYILRYSYQEFCNKFFKVLFLAFIIVALDGYVQSIFGINSLGWQSPVLNRLTGFFGNEQILGSYLVRLFPLATVAIIISLYNNYYLDYYLIFFLLFGFCIIVLTGERSSAVLAIIFITIFIFFNSLLSFKKILFTYFLVLISLLVIFTSNERMQGRLKNTVEGIYMKVDDSGNVKKSEKINIFTFDTESHYRSSYLMFLDNKIFGKGPKTFRKHCSNPKYNYDIHSCTTHPHNTYIQLLAETGIIGFSFVFGLYLLLIIKLISLIKNKNNNKISKLNYNVQLCFLLCILINLFPLIPTGNFFNNYLSIFYYLPIGFYLYHNQKNFFKIKLK